jgi:LysR family transcriptional activator of nhaA
MSDSWLNYHHLYYFKTIATEGGIAKASKVLRLGQPTLSAQLKTFEDVIGHKLFDRQNRSLVLTDAGRVALEYANGIFRLGGELIEAINERPVKGRIPFQVGVIDTIPKHISLQLINQARELEDCVVTVVEGRGADLVNELKNHKLDLVLMNIAPSVGDASALRARKVARVPVVVCGAKKYQNLKRDFPESLGGQPFVLPTSDSQLRHSFDHWIALNEIQINPVVEAQDTSLQKLLATHGMGLIVAATPAIEELVHDKELAVIGRLDGVYEEYWAVEAARKIRHPVASRLMKSLSISAQ